MPLEFLTIEEVLDIHLDQIARYGGDAATRDLGLLESALAQPEAVFGGQWLAGDLFGMAAAYLFHIVRNHPFVDGNKRTGTVACLVFLDLNGYELDVDWETLVDVVLGVAEGRLSKPEIAEFLRAHSTPRPPSPEGP